MNKIRTIASRLDVFLKNGDLTNSPTLQNILSDYNETCIYVNERLSRCELLLEKDKAGEAILLAERIPSLFEIVPLLQSPDLTTLFDICSIYHLPSPPVLKTSAFKLLEKAQTEMGTMENLLAELRKLARTPGSEEKVIVLRKISALEPENQEWKKQIRQAESVCVPAMIDAAQKAITDGDFEKLEELNEALTSPAWQLVIPEIVIEKIYNTLAKEKQRQLKLRAAKILDEVNKAYSAQNLVDFIIAKNHWKMLCEIDMYLPSDEDSKHFSRADAYFGNAQDKLAKDNAFMDLLRQLNSFMLSASSIEFTEIEQMYNQLTIFDRPIPKNITDFVTAKKHEHFSNVLRQTRKRRLSNFVYSFVLVMLIVIGCLCTWYSFQRKNFIKLLSAAMQNKDTNKANELIAEIESSVFPYLTFSPYMQEIQIELQKVNEQNKKIEEDFDKIASEFENLKKSEINEKNLVLLNSKLMECKEYAKNEKTMAKYSELEKTFNSSFVGKLKELQEKHGNTIIAEIRKARNEFDMALKGEKYEEADVIINHLAEKIIEFEQLNYFDKTKLSEGDIKLLDKMNWIIERHYCICKHIQSLTEKEQYDEAQKVLEIYVQDEKQWPELVIATKSKYQDVSSAEELRKVIEQKMVEANGNRLMDELNNLQDCIEEAIQKENYSYAEELLTEYKCKFAEIENLFALSGTTNTKIQSLRSPREMETFISGLKIVGEIYASSEEYTSYIASSKVREAFIRKINQALDYQTLDNTQREQLVALKQQVITFGRIIDYQTSKTYWDNIEYKYCDDLIKERQWTQKEAEILEKTKQTIEKFVQRNMDKELLYFSFRDSKSKVHSWIFSKDEYKPINESTVGINNIKFKIRKETISIAGDKVTVSSDKDGDELSIVYNNVEFLSPVTISKQKISNARIPYQQFLPNVLSNISVQDKTFFTEDYYSIIASLKSQEQTCVLQRLELYKLLLSPFILARKATFPFGTRQTKIFYDESNGDMFDAIAEISDDINKMLLSAQKKPIGTQLTPALEDIDDKYKPELDQIDFSVIDKLIRAINYERDMRSMLLKRQFTCIGIAVKQKDGTIKLYSNVDLILKKGEIWALTSDSGSMIAGISDGNEITWNENANISVALLFVTDDFIDTYDLATDYRNNMLNLGVSTVVWPSFFPENLTK